MLLGFGCGTDHHRSVALLENRSLNQARSRTHGHARPGREPQRRRCSRLRRRRLPVSAGPRHRPGHDCDRPDRRLGAGHQSPADARACSAARPCSRPRRTDRRPGFRHARPSDTEDPQIKFVSQILRSTEVVWTDAFQQMGRTYENPKLRLFRDSYPTACGQGQAAAGPFYCPDDRIVYLDLGFFDLMTQQLHAPGQFAHAYVIGHEVGHHVQNLLGILGRVDAARARSSAADVQCPERQDRAAGRLLRRRLGAPRAAGAGLAPGAGRHRNRAQRRQSDRRRHSAKEGAWHGGAGNLHPWHQRPAGLLVQARHRLR